MHKNRYCSLNICHHTVHVCDLAWIIGYNDYHYQNIEFHNNYYNFVHGQFLYHADVHRARLNQSLCGHVHAHTYTYICTHSHHDTVGLFKHPYSNNHKTVSTCTTKNTGHGECRILHSECIPVPYSAHYCKLRATAAARSQYTGIISDIADKKFNLIIVPILFFYNEMPYCNY